MEHQLVVQVQLVRELMVVARLATGVLVVVVVKVLQVAMVLAAIRVEMVVMESTLIHRLQPPQALV
jgi:hypothetical protein